MTFTARTVVSYVEYSYCCHHNDSKSAPTNAFSNFDLSVLKDMFRSKTDIAFHRDSSR